ncbi:MAG: hypothetical protein QXS54_01440 [Candidatus Methanomethylicaceae archaeon]
MSEGQAYLKNRKRLPIAQLIPLGVFLLLGCSPFVDRDQTAVVPEVTVVLEPGHTVGQTFVARHGGLNGVEFWLEPQPGSEGRIRLRLRADPQSTVDLAEAVLSLDQITAPGFYRFSFAPDNRSHSVYRYGFLELEGVGGVRVGAASGEAYLDGAAYRDHEPLDAQLAFRLIYDPWGMALELGWAGLKGLGLLAVAVLLYLVPGYAALAYLRPLEATRGDEGLPWPARMGLAMGLSLALYPLLFLWTDLAGLHLGPLYAWGPVVLGMVALAWRYRRWRPRRGQEAIKRWARSDAFWPDLAFIFILALVFGVRLLVVRTLDAPMWGDSYQHSVIAQLLVDHGGLFDSWEPYAELQSFTYHFGFHSLVAVFHWLTGIPVYRATLWIGQILNGLAVLALYPLSVRISGNRWAGVSATLIAGLLVPMPMFYVNWGRYTQLAGQVILPITVVFTWDFLQTRPCNWRLAGLAWLLIGGLALTHYRVLIFFVIFVIAYLLLTPKDSLLRALSGVSVLGVGGGILFLPWFLHIFAGNILRSFERQLMTPPNAISDFTRQYNAIGDITGFMAPLGWLLLIWAIGFGLWRRQRAALVISLWWFLLLIATNPDWLYLPGSGSISNFAIFIAVYIPAGLLIGNMIGEWITHWSGRFRTKVLAILLCVLGIFGGLKRLGDIDVTSHALITHPDLRAMTWIRENLPEDARFLVNSFFAYGGSVIVGADGGWWLPLLAGRQTTVPPLNYSSERGPQPEYVKWVNQLTAQIQAHGLDHPETLKMLKRRGITYVYIGQREGKIGAGAKQLFSPSDFIGSRAFRVLYHRDRVWIFVLRSN